MKGAELLQGRRGGKGRPKSRQDRRRCPKTLWDPKCVRAQDSCDDKKDPTTNKIEKASIFSARAHGRAYPSANINIKQDRTKVDLFGPCACACLHQAAARNARGLAGFFCIQKRRRFRNPSRHAPTLRAAADDGKQVRACEKRLRVACSSAERTVEGCVGGRTGQHA